MTFVHITIICIKWGMSSSPKVRLTFAFICCNLFVKLLFAFFNFLLYRCSSCVRFGYAALRDVLFYRDVDDTAEVKTPTFLTLFDLSRRWDQDLTRNFQDWDETEVFDFEPEMRPGPRPWMGDQVFFKTLQIVAHLTHLGLFLYTVTTTTQGGAVSNSVSCSDTTFHWCSV